MKPLLNKSPINADLAAAERCEWALVTIEGDMRRQFEKAMDEAALMVDQAGHYGIAGGLVLDVACMKGYLTDMLADSFGPLRTQMRLRVEELEEEGGE